MDLQPARRPVPCVRFVDVKQRFGAGPNVLDGITLDVPEGTTTAVVGASGSGKTTLLQTVNAVVVPNAGQVQVFGAPIPQHDLVAFRRRIGYSVQGAGLFPHLRIGDNVTLLARLEGWSRERIEARLAQLLEQMGLSPEVADRYPAALSGGQQQRAGLCRALMLEPRLLLLDEPFSGIDPITRTGIYRTFADVQQLTGVSTLLVTHDMREAVKLASHLVILRNGRVLQAARSEEVLNKPADDYVRMLVAEQL